MLEGEQCEQVLQHLVARRHVRHALQVGGELGRHLLEHGRRLAEPVEAGLDHRLLPLGLADMLGERGLELRVVLEPVVHRAHGRERLALEGIGVAQSDDQDVARAAGHGFVSGKGRRRVGQRRGRD